MFRLLLLTLFIAPISTCFAQVDFTARVVADRMHIPWDLEEGPDGKIWVTNRDGIVERVDPDNGSRDTIADYRELVHNASEAGLLGMAIHPAYPDSPYVFLAYVFTDFNGNEQRVKQVARCTMRDGKLEDRTVIYEYRPAALWHIGCRLLFLSDTTLLITNGDQPTPDSAASITSDVGKIIRLNTDGSVPHDNPFPGQRPWSLGHRNPQGLVRLPDGTIYSSEHGDNTEDEVNIIEKGGYYGWPHVEGPCNTPSEIEHCTANNVIEPVWSTGSHTLAPAGMDYYNHDRYPALKNAVLQTFLKSARLSVLTLSEDHQSVVSYKAYLLYRYGRLRDVLVTRDGRVFICTGNVGYNGISPFPKETDDKLIELIPVWERTPSTIRPISDTLVFRADPGEQTPIVAEFCSDGAGSPVWFTDYSTNPGNIFEARHWQDGASVEGSDCYPFRMMHWPDTVMPRRAVATVTYDNGSNTLQTASLVLIGLPRSGWVRSLKDTVEFVSSSVIPCDLKNIGERDVVVEHIRSNSSISVTSNTELPVTLAPGETKRFSLAASSKPPLGTSLTVEIQFYSLGDDPEFNHRSHFQMKSVLFLDVEDENHKAVTIVPNPTSAQFALITDSEDVLSVRIVDVLGTVVYQSNTINNRTTISPAAFTNGGVPGAYYVSYTHSNRTTTVPLVLAR